MKKSTALLAIIATLGVSAPSFAGAMDTGKSVAGSTTAMLIDVPEGIIVDSAWKCPHKAHKSLAAAFGDEDGWKQNIVGATMGIPLGAVFGVPYGAIKGAQYGAKNGWDKPFSGDSFVVKNEE